MRIIAGNHKGRKLNTLIGDNTRPMMDRMKEAIFQILGPYFDGEVVLDLFGGSGALSLEALSRGAKYAYINDASFEAIRIINKNVIMLQEQSHIQVIHASYETALSFVSKQSFDLVFLDPPYHMHVNSDIISYLIDNKMLKENACIICHFRKGSMEKERRLEVVKEKIYGDSEWCIYRFNSV